jgi:transposase InsO family protein
MLMPVLVKPVTTNSPPVRGFERQRARRERERNARLVTSACGARLLALGASPREAATCLERSPRTLRSWNRYPGEVGCAPASRGRPCRNATPERCREVRELLTELGPHAGLPLLGRIFPEVARGELRELQAAERLRRRAGRAEHAYRLRWHRVGAVWAMDYAEPPTPIDGRYGALFSVRDLTSGRQLAWLPVAAATAAETVAALSALFLEHGPPLVLKSDNGSAFISAHAASLLATWRVVPLFSPPRTPQYNGACEAGIGGLKTRTHHRAAGDGRPGRWTCEDVEAARRMADEEHYPWRLRGQTADEVWRLRTPLTADERRRFQETLADRRCKVRNLLGIPLEESLDRAAQASLDRKAVRLALVELGYLSLHGSAITPTISNV